MQTTINNNLRVFQIVSSTSKQYFCNLQDIPNVIATNELKTGYYTIYHFWDNKPKKCSKKYINEMFAANNISCKLV